MTATQTKLRRGTAAQIASMTPVEGEVVVNTTDERIHVGDGTTAGGFGCPNLRDIQQQKAIVATVGGTANAITLTHSPVVTSYVAGLRTIFKPTSDSSSAVTLNVDGLGAKDAKYALDNVLTAFSSTTILKSGLYYEAVYDGTQFQILGVQRPSGGLTAWGKFNAAGTLLSGSGVTASKNSTGDYTLTFSPAMPNANYSISGSAQRSSSSGGMMVSVKQGTTPTTTSCTIVTVNSADGLEDSAGWSIHVMAS